MSTEDALFADERWETFGLFREAYLAVSARIDAAVREEGGLDPAMADLVFRLARTPGRALRAVDISRALSTSTSTTTRLLDESEQLGLTRREPHPEDRRAINVVLTDEGLLAARTAGRVALEAAQAHLFDRLTRRQVTEFHRIVRILRTPE